MITEFETQVLDIDPEEIKDKLRQLGAEEKPEVLQKRWIFDIKEGDVTGEWIRLRNVNGISTLTYKNRSGTGISGTKEIETEIKDFDKAAGILSRLNCFIGKYYQENKRQSFKLDEINFELDTWPMIPAYLEIESDNEEKVKQGLRLLGIEGKDSGHPGLIKIYSKYGINLHDYPELRFKEKISQDFKKALIIVAKRLNTSGIKWVLNGSTNFMLQDMDIIPNDIDIAVSYKDLKEARKLFSDHEQSGLKDLSNGEGQEFRFKIGNIDVQVCADYEHGIYHKKAEDGNNIIRLKVDDIEIPALKLEAEAECYEHISRPEKVKMITEFIKTKEED